MVKRDDLEKIRIFLLNEESNIIYPLNFSSLRNIYNESLAKALYTLNLPALTSCEIKILESSILQSFELNNLSKLYQQRESISEIHFLKLQHFSDISSCYSIFLFNIQKLFRSFFKKSTSLFTFFYEPLENGSMSLDMHIADFFNDFKKELLAIGSESCKKLLLAIESALRLNEDHVREKLETAIVLDIEERVARYNGIVAEILQEFEGKIAQELPEFDERLFKNEKKRVVDRIKEIWQDMCAEMCTIKEGEIRKNIKEFLSALVDGSLELFDRAICSEECRKELFYIVAAAVPEEMEENDERLQNIKDLVVGADEGRYIIREKENVLESVFRFYRNSDRKCIDFCILSFILAASGFINVIKNKKYTVGYNIKYRKWVYNLANEIFERKKKFLNDLCLEFNECKIIIIIEEELTAILDDNPILDNFSYNESANSVLKLETLRKANSFTSSITVSGWLSSEDDSVIPWNALFLSRCPSEILNLKWQASSTSDFIKSFIHLSYKTLKNSVSKKFVQYGFNPCDYDKQDSFNQSSKVAKHTGAALADFISTSEYFKDRAINLIGFSLGTRVIQHCLLELTKRKLYVNNVFLLGGATPCNETKWGVCRKAVLGRLVNVYSENDLALGLLFTNLTFKNPIGSCRLEVEGVENYDVTKVSPGHLDYRDKLGKILEMINYENLF